MDTEVALRGELLAQRIVLEKLWVEFLVRFPEPDEEAAAIGADLLRRVAAEAQQQARARPDLPAASVEAIGEIWASITAQVAQSQEPLPIRLADRSEEPDA